jgi:hypothetical protein
MPTHLRVNLNTIFQRYFLDVLSLDVTISCFAEISIADIGWQHPLQAQNTL